MKKKNAFIILFVLVVCFIWGNSLLSAETSGALSDAVGDFLSYLFDGDGEASVAENVNIRKIAHFFEFCVLAVVGCLLLRCLEIIPHLRLSLVAFGGLFFSLLDETIQIFSGRGSSVRDIWIDIAGYTTGCLVVYLTVFFRKKVTIKRKNEHN